MTDPETDPAGPVSAGRARELTEALRDALADARRAVLVLAGRVRAAHEARVWVVLGYRSWEQYAAAELGVSRAQAYRLIGMSRTVDVITAAAAAALPVSPAGDVGDLGLSGRALRDIGGRVDEVAALIAARLATATRAGPVTAEQVRAIVAGTVQQCRRPGPPAGAPAPGPVSELRALGDGWAQLSHRIGEYLLEIAPAYRSDRQAAADLVEFCEDVGLAMTEALACRRYAATGDRRALDDLP